MAPLPSGETNRLFYTGPANSLTLVYGSDDLTLLYLFICMSDLSSVSHSHQCLALGRIETSNAWPGGSLWLLKLKEAVGGFSLLFSWRLIYSAKILTLCGI